MCSSDLSDFGSLQPGDAVIQNAANSAVGMAVIQMARIRGIKTVNIIRKRADNPDVEKDLKSLGADVVIGEEQLRGLFVDKGPLEKGGIVGGIRLALNAVGGPSTTDMMRLLAYANWVWEGCDWWRRKRK